MEAVTLKKYPRTPHLEGSRLQPGDEDLSQVSFSYIRGKHLVVEEKIDGANTAISFSEEGELLLQSRGHYLTGGYRERHYNLMKQWANIHQDAFFEVLAPATSCTASGCLPSTRCTMIGFPIISWNLTFLTGRSRFSSLRSGGTKC